MVHDTGVQTDCDAQNVAFPSWDTQGFRVKPMQKAMYGGKVVGMPSAIAKGAEGSQGGREICIPSQTAEKKGMHF